MNAKEQRAWLAGRDVAVARLRSMAALYRAYSERAERAGDSEAQVTMWNHGETLLDAARAIESDVLP